jgi:hypothetical protein
MTLIISEAPVAEQASLDPITILKTQESPSYCCICACPTLTPRLPTPHPHEPGPISIEIHDMPTPKWLHQYHHLQPSSGILPHPPPVSDLRDSNNPHKRIIAIHLYCLRSVLDIIQSDMFSTGGVNDEQVMIGYSIPRYTGFGPWMNWKLKSAQRPEASWRGLADQRNRWELGVEGSHLCPVGIYFTCERDKSD